GTTQISPLLSPHQRDHNFPPHISISRTIEGDHYLRILSTAFNLLHARRRPEDPRSPHSHPVLACTEPFQRQPERIRIRSRPQDSQALIDCAWSRRSHLGVDLGPFIIVIYDRRFLAEVEYHLGPLHIADSCYLEWSFAPANCDRANDRIKRKRRGNG